MECMGVWNVLDHECGIYMIMNSNGALGVWEFEM